MTRRRTLRLRPLVLCLVLSLAGAGAAAGCGAGEAGTPTAAVPTTTAARVSAAPSSTPAPQDEVVLAFAGDVHFTERTTALLDDPAAAFGPVAEVFRAADLALVNLETAVTDRGTPQPKRFHFRAPAAAYQAVKAAGIDAVSLGNNHSLDYGPEGLADTLDNASRAGVPTIGAGRNAAQAYRPWLVTVRQTRIAFLGISQVHELEVTWNATDTRAGVAHARDATRALAAVRSAGAQADVVVVFMHWGQERSDCPTEEMRTFARKLAGAGADVIVGTHAHLLLGDGWLGGSYVAYGLGNFLWWWNDAYSNDTGVLRITLRDSKVTRAELVPAYISRDTGQPRPVTGAEATRITQKFASLRACTGLAAQRS